MKTNQILTVVILLTPLVAARAQESPTVQVPQGTTVPTSPPQAAPPALVEVPTPQPASTTGYHPKANDSYISHAGVFCGLGASVSSAATKPTTGCGAGLVLLPVPIFFEVGVLGPQANRSYLSGYISLDSSIPLARPSSKYLPLAIVGYSRLFETGHALDYGFALALPRFGKPRYPGDSLRIELRDYWTFANPTQHNVMLRIGLMGEETD